MIGTYGLSHVFLRTPGTRDLVALHAGGSPGVDHLGFRLVQPEELDDALRTVDAAGGTIASRGVHRHHSHVDSPFALVADPDGYAIELLARDPAGPVIP